MPYIMMGSTLDILQWNDDNSGSCGMLTSNAETWKDTHGNF